MGDYFYIVLILAVGCSKSPLGPEISERPDPVTLATSTVTSGGQTDAGNVAGTSTVINTNTDADPDTGTDTGTGTTTDTSSNTATATGSSTGTGTGTAGGGPSCQEDTTQNVYYPGATVTHTFGCDEAIQAATDGSGNRPTYLTPSALPAATVTFTGSQTGGTGSTDWTTRFNALTDVVANTTILATIPTTSAEAAQTLTDNTTRSLTFDVTLDGTYDGVGGDVKVLMGDAVSPATTSNGAVAYAASDIPGLTYSDGACAGTPSICPTTGSHTASTAAAGFDVLWDYGVFDQGQYDVATRGYLVLEDAAVYSAVDHSILTTSNGGTEEKVVNGVGPIGKTTYKSATSWYNYTPPIAYGDTLSSSSKDVFASIYTANNTSHIHYAGVATADRLVDPDHLTLHWFDNTSDATRVSLSANAVSMAIAGTSNGGWIYAGGSDGGSGSTNLILSYFGPNDVSPTINPISTYSNGTFVNSMALTPAFNDGGTQRHGLAFYGNFGGNTARRIWVSKIDSHPSNPAVKADYFAATSYYLAGAGNEFDPDIPSFPITVNQGADLSMVKISYAAISGVNYFYVGWRNDADHKLYFARVEASPAGNPIVRLTDVGEEIGNMDSAGATVVGRPGYAIAGGQDTAGNAILGVLYAEKNGGATTCNFQAMRLVGTTLEKYGTAHVVGSTTECRFPQLFYNQSAAKFVATHVRGTTFATMYDEFQFNGPGDALANASPTDVTVTTRATAPCQFSATYSETWHRLGLLSLESTSCAANRTDSLLYDVYKPSRR